jgi:hypothetical protein
MWSLCKTTWQRLLDRMPSLLACGRQLITTFASPTSTLKTVYGNVSQGQEFVTRQVEEGNRRFAQAADISGRAVHAGTESVKSAGEEALNEADQIGRARNRAK